MKVGLKREDALCRSKWIVGVVLIATRLRLIWPPSLVGILLDFNICFSVSLSLLVGCDSFPRQKEMKLVSHG